MSLLDADFLIPGLRPSHLRTLPKILFPVIHESCIVREVTTATEPRLGARREVSDQARSRGNRIKQARLKADLSQAELAARMGCLSQAHLSRLESGRSAPTREHRAALEQVLDLRLRPLKRDVRRS